MKDPITTHILDTSIGKPADDVLVELFIKVKEEWKKLASAKTNKDGRIEGWLKEKIEKGIYQLVFYPQEYFTKNNRFCFYPKIIICFQVENSEQHYHVPLLLSGFGYNTYRGS